MTTYSEILVRILFFSLLGVGLVYGYEQIFGKVTKMKCGSDVIAIRSQLLQPKIFREVPHIEVRWSNLCDAKYPHWFNIPMGSRFPYRDVLIVNDEKNAAVCKTGMFLRSKDGDRFFSGYDYVSYDFLGPRMYSWSQNHDGEIIGSIKEVPCEKFERDFPFLPKYENITSDSWAKSMQGYR